VLTSNNHTAVVKPQTCYWEEIKISWPLHEQNLIYFSSEQRYTEFCKMLRSSWRSTPQNLGMPHNLTIYGNILG
jgi:hypothetical protein